MEAGYSSLEEEEEMARLIGEREEHDQKAIIAQDLEKEYEFRRQLKKEKRRADNETRY